MNEIITKRREPENQQSSQHLQESEKEQQIHPTALGENDNIY